MRAVVQRVSRASVRIGERPVAETGSGLLVLLGVGSDDEEVDADYLADKIVHLRIFNDQDGKMNRSLAEVQGSLLIVSQFTLFGDCRKGRRPSYTDAAAPEKGRELYEYFVERVRQSGLSVQTGEFQAMMEVELINDGPVTLLLDSKRQF